MYFLKHQRMDMKETLNLSEVLWVPILKQCNCSCLKVADVLKMYASCSLVLMHDNTLVVAKLKPISLQIHHMWTLVYSALKRYYLQTVSTDSLTSIYDSFLNKTRSFGD